MRSAKWKLGKIHFSEFTQRFKATVCEICLNYPKESHFFVFRLKSASNLFILVRQGQVKQTKQTNNGKHSITNFFGTLRPSLMEAEPDDAEIFAVEDELRRVELQLLVGTQHFPFPLCIIH